MSYLICTKCKRYYKLQPGEYPEDFMDRCACGGKLIYSDTNLLSSKKTHGPKNIIIHLEEAIKHHQKAASYLETGNLHEAQICTIKANGQTEHALMGQKEIIKKYY